MTQPADSGSVVSATYLPSSPAHIVRRPETIIRTSSEGALGIRPSQGMTQGRKHEHVAIIPFHLVEIVLNLGDENGMAAGIARRDQVLGQIRHARSRARKKYGRYVIIDGAKRGDGGHSSVAAHLEIGSQ